MAALSLRQVWMATLAKATLADLEACVATLAPLPDYQFLRSPEIGLTMVRARAGGTGAAFNLGEMSLTRCVVQIPGSEAAESISGFGYVAGRSKRHAELAALCDALMQRDDWRDRVQAHVITPLQAAYQSQQAASDRQTEATRVNFFTLLRGES